MCWLWHWRHSTSPLIESLLYSDEFSGVSFADEHFEQPQFGFDVLVFVVLHSQWGAVLLLNVPAGTRRQSLRCCEKKTFVSRFLIMQFQIFDIDKLFFFLPSVLSKKLVLKLFQVLANPLLLLSRLLELLYKFLPVGWGEMFFKCLTLKYTQTSSIYKKNPQKSTTLARFLFFLYYTGHTGGRQLVSKQIKSVLDWLQLLCNTMAKVCKQPLADKHFAINLNGCALSVMFLCNMGLDLIRCQMVVSWLYSYIKARLLGNSV